MVANPNSLYLQDIPKPQSGKIVQLTAVSASGASVSSGDVAVELAMMMQTILNTMSKMVQYLEEEEEVNAKASQDNVGLAQAQASQAQEAEQNYEKQVEAQEHRPWWEKALDVIVKYVLPIILIAVTFLVFGPAAGLIAVGIAALTMIPIHNGKSIVALGADAAASGIGKAFGASEGTIEILQGVFNVAAGVLLAVAGGFATAGFTVAQAAETATEVAVQDATSTVTTVAEDTIGTIADDTTTITDSAGSTAAKSSEDAATRVGNFKSAAGKMIGVNAFASATGNSNCWYDIFYGAWQDANSNSNDQQKGQEIATILSLIMNLAVVAASLGTSMSSISSVGAQGVKTFFSDMFSTSNLQAFTSFVNKFQSAAMGAEAGVDGYQGYQNYELQELESLVTRALGEIQYNQGTSSIINQNTAMVNSYLRNMLSAYDHLVGSNANFSTAEFTEAQQMMLNNQQV